MQVKEFMTKDLTCCTPEAKLQEVAQLMVERDCGAIPVVESQWEKTPVGIVTDRDIACRAIAAGKNPLELTVGEVMTSPLVTISPEDTLEECCRVMEENQVRRVPVVDEKGYCCGIVAQADVARRAPEHQTAELVHDISMQAHARAV